MFVIFRSEMGKDGVHEISSNNEKAVQVNSLHNDAERAKSDGDKLYSKIQNVVFYVRCSYTIV